MYTVEPKYRNGKVVEGEWVLLKDGDLTGICSTDWPRLEAMCFAMNNLTPEQKEQANVAAYRKTVMGVAA
jgi:hypothetical protein